MKRRYLRWPKGWVMLAAAAWLAVVVAYLVQPRIGLVVALLTAAALFALVTVLSYVLFVQESRLNALYRERGRGYRGRGRAGTLDAREGARGPVDDRVGDTLVRALTPQSGPVRVGAVLPAIGALELPDAEVVHLVPGAAAGAVSVERLDAVVLDRLAFRSGPWEGAESSVATDLLLQLEQLQFVCRDRDIPVLMVDFPSVPDVNSARLRSLADIVFPVAPQRELPEGVQLSPLFQQLQHQGEVRARMALPGATSEVPGAG